MKLQPLRGTKDLIGPTASAFRWIDEQAWHVARHFGFQEISTPIIESTDLFKRSLGETTDIITKEMYSFDDRGGDSITLRPAGTAGVARAYISGGMDRQLPLRFYYNGPMFRYERPQHGRQRQFHQLGAEILGIDSPFADSEVISFGYLFLKEIGILNKVQLEINTLGDAASRKAYRETLVSYFNQNKSSLSEDSLKRLETNPLRILDSKDEQDKKIVAGAPAFADSLNTESHDFFNKVLLSLDNAGIAYVHNQKLVRGLDYYCHTVFEFTTTELGSQNAVLSGGRYDNLIEMLGGRPTPGIGWAAGIERLAMLVDESKITKAEKPIVILALNDEAQILAAKLSLQLREKGSRVETLYSGSNIGKLMKKADGLNAKTVVIIGEDELKTGILTAKDMTSGEQKKIAADQLPAHINLQ